MCPLLIVVTGRPGSGKTTLAHRLAAEIYCPAICRDEVKEGWVHTHGKNPPEANKLLYPIFFDTIRGLLENGITHIAEAAFQHKLWAPQLEELRKIADIRLIICQIDAKLARQRTIDRQSADPRRSHFHGDRAAVAGAKGVAMPIGDYDPPHLDVPTLEVDTADLYRPSIEQIARFARPPFSA